jgi:hypothetical protein
MPNQCSQTTQPIVDVILPVDISDPAGPAVTGKAELASLRGDRGVGCLTSTDGMQNWIDEFDHFVFQIRTDGTRIAIRKTTEDDLKRFRVPIWIQSAETPICCGREMVFVGQLDDNDLWSEPPEDAMMWWHDIASFYVFTCPLCLECSAVGQQY